MFVYGGDGRKNYRWDVINLLQAANDDSVFGPSSPSPGAEFNVDVVQKSTSMSLGISIYGGADPVTGPAAVFIDKLSQDGLAACDGRLHPGKNSTSTL